MKKLNILLIIGTLLLGVACEDEDKQPQPFVGDLDRAPFVSWDIESPVIDISDLENSTFGGMMSAPSNNVASHQINVSRVSNGIGSDTVMLRTVTEFPTNVRISAQDLSDALGVSITDFLPGDRFDFIAISTGTDGVVIDPTVNLSPSAFTGNGALGDLNQAYFLNTFLSCAFDAANIAGTYDVITLGFAGTFGETNFVREVTTGPGENQITIVGGEYPSAGSTDLIVSVNPVTGAASLGGPGTAFSADAGAFATDVYGSVSGFVFSCSGDINLTVDFSAFAGNAHPFVLRKRN